MPVSPSSCLFVSIDITDFNSSIVDPTHLIDHHLHRLAVVQIPTKKQWRLPIVQE